MNDLYSAVSSDIRRIDIELCRIEAKRKKADVKFCRKLDKMEHELTTVVLPRLRRVAFNIRQQSSITV